METLSDEYQRVLVAYPYRIRYDTQYVDLWEVSVFLRLLLVSNLIWRKLWFWGHPFVFLSDVPRLNWVQPQGLKLLWLCDGKVKGSMGSPSHLRFNSKMTPFFVSLYQWGDDESNEPPRLMPLPHLSLMAMMTKLWA